MVDRVEELKSKEIAQAVVDLSGTGTGIFAPNLGGQPTVLRSGVEVNEGAYNEFVNAFAQTLLLGFETGESASLVRDVETIGFLADPATRAAFFQSVHNRIRDTLAPQRRRGAYAARDLHRQHKVEKMGMSVVVEGFAHLLRSWCAPWAWCSTVFPGDVDTHGCTYCRGVEMVERVRAFCPKATDAAMAWALEKASEAGKLVG